jgi:hypothetical protein
MYVYIDKFMYLEKLRWSTISKRMEWFADILHIAATLSYLISVLNTTRTLHIIPVQYLFIVEIKAMMYVVTL